MERVRWKEEEEEGEIKAQLFGKTSAHLFLCCEFGNSIFSQKVLKIINLAFRKGAKHVSSFYDCAAFSSTSAFF